MLKIYFKLKALNAEKKVNQLIKNGIDVYEFQRNGKELTFCVGKKDAQKVEQFFQNEEIEVYAKGAESVLSFLKGRIGIIVGSAIFLLLIIIFSNVLINVQVLGNNFVQTNQIIDILEQNGYNKFKPISSIDTKDVENCLINSFSEISFASAMVKGNTLVINIRENKQEINENFTPICAEFSGVISSMQINSGTALVSVGDVVKKGQQLVAPYEIISGNQISVTPKAEICAKVFLKGQVEYDTSKKIIGRTGQTFQERTTSFLGMNVPCLSKGNKQIKLNANEIEVSEETVKGIIPIKITKTTYYELGEIGDADFERDRTLLERESIYLAYEQIKDNFEIKNQTTQITQIESVYYVTTYLEIEKNIAIQNQ